MHDILTFYLHIFGENGVAFEYIEYPVEILCQIGTFSTNRKSDLSRDIFKEANKNLQMTHAVQVEMPNEQKKQI